MDVVGGLRVGWGGKGGNVSAKNARGRDEGLQEKRRGPPLTFALPPFFHGMAYFDLEQKAEHGMGGVQGGESAPTKTPEVPSVEGTRVELCGLPSDAAGARCWRSSCSRHCPWCLSY